MHNVEFDELRGIIHDIGSEWKHKSNADFFATIHAYRTETGALPLSERQEDELFELYQNYKKTTKR